MLVRLTEKVVRITQVMGNTRMHSSKCTNLKKCDFSYLLSSLSSYGDDIFSLESLKRNVLLFSMDTELIKYLRLRLETLLARLAKLANEILEAYL